MENTAPPKMGKGKGFLEVRWLRLSYKKLVPACVLYWLSYPEYFFALNFTETYETGTVIICILLTKK